MTKKLSISLLFLLLIVQVANAQTKKAFKYYNDAIEAIREDDYEEALKKIDKAIEEYNPFGLAYELRGDIYLKQNDYKTAISNYEQAISFGKMDYLYNKLAKVQHSNALYADALQNFINYGNKLTRKLAPDEKELWEKYVASCKFAIEAIKNPVDFNPTNLGPNINTENWEYSPSISADGKSLVFTHRLPDFDVPSEDFYYTELKDGKWTVAAPVKGFLNTRNNEGAQCLSADGSIMVFTGCNREDSYGGCDLYYSILQEDGTWTPPINMGKNINTRWWDSQPTLSGNGKTLYFSSARRGGFGGTDIWYSELQDNGVWSVAKNLGPIVNTSDDDVSPFLHWDGQTMYLSSAGHVGFGGRDFFVVRKDESGEWAEVKNLGYPINTPADEFSLIVSPDGKTGYYATNTIEDGYGGMDLYSFDMPEEAQAIGIAYLEGQVLNKLTGKGLQSEITVVDIETGQDYLNAMTDEKGNFFITLPSNKNFALNIDKKDFLFYSENFSLTDNENPERAYEMLVTLNPITKGEKIQLHNVFYETGLYDLKPQSLPELDKLYSFLVQNPNLKIEISGHTDNQGAETLNLELSKNRALSVYNYLVKKGINKNRLSYKGYGASEPVASNDNEKGRKQNRRTEIKILSNVP